MSTNRLNSDMENTNYNAGTETYPGLLAILILIVAIILLFTARYPRGLFNFVMGLNRWVYRVHAYTWLMTDKYPPFRLDQGPTEPTAAEVLPVEPAS